VRPAAARKLRGLAGRVRRHASERARRRALGAASGDDSFITGNGLAARCRHVLNYEGATVNARGEPGWWFCKADYVQDFFARHAPEEPFVLFTHNGDRSIGAAHAALLERPGLVAWFAANADLRHPKLHAFPLGIANPYWPHGDVAELRRAQALPLEKTRLFNAAFDVRTNPAERERCVRATGLAPSPAQPFPEYLRELGSSLFCIAPSGNGIDTHRAWEALYLRTIPVVTRSVLTEQHLDLPLVVLDDWSDFGSVDLSPELYAAVWGDFDPAELRLDRYLERVRAVVEGRAGATAGR
jgi:hypothetical protein